MLRSAVTPLGSAPFEFKPWDATGLHQLPRRLQMILICQESRPLLVFPQTSRRVECRNKISLPNHQPEVYRGAFPICVSLVGDSPYLFANRNAVNVASSGACRRGSLFGGLAGSQEGWEPDSLQIYCEL